MGKVCIGIITIPHITKQSHIMKSYVDWFEQAGIGVVPIPFDTLNHAMYFRLVHGLFIPGTDKGYDVKNKVFMKSVATFIELSQRPGEYFPIWGTCFGFEVLLSLIGGIRHFKHYPMKGPNSITRLGHPSMIDTATMRVIQNHEYSISPADFMENPRLRAFFTIDATAVDSRGKTYVAAIEAKQYPIYGVQFHPERANSGFLDFLHAKLQRNHKVMPICVEHITMKAHKCLHYEGLKDELCYFF